MVSLLDGDFELLLLWGVVYEVGLDFFRLPIVGEAEIELNCLSSVFVDEEPCELDGCGIDVNCLL